MDVQSILVYWDMQGKSNIVGGTAWDLRGRFYGKDLQRVSCGKGVEERLSVRVRCNRMCKIPRKISFDYSLPVALEY